MLYVLCFMFHVHVDVEFMGLLHWQINWRENSLRDRTSVPIPTRIRHRRHDNNQQQHPSILYLVVKVRTRQSRM